MPRTVTFTATTPANILPRTGFSIQEQFADRPGYFRWTTGVAQLQLPNPGGSANIYMRLAGGPGRSIPVQLYSGGLTQTFLVAPDPRIYTFLLPPAPREQLLLRIASPTVHDDRDDRALGVVVGDIVLVGRGKAPAWIWLTLISATVGAYGLLRLTGRRRLVTLLIVLGIQLPVVLIQAHWGWQYAMFAPTLLLGLVVAAGMVMLWRQREQLYPLLKQGGRQVWHAILTIPAQYRKARRKWQEWAPLQRLDTYVMENPRVIVITLLTVSVGAGINWFYYTYHSAVNILFWDQWDFYTPFFDDRNLWEIFSWQHGPHRQGIGFVLSKVVADLTQWNTRAEALVVASTLFCAMLIALFMKRHLFGRFHFADCIIPLIFLTPMQYEILVVTVNPAHGAVPVLLVMLYCIGWLQQNRVLRYTFVLILNFLLLYTGFGVFMGPVTVMLLIFDLYHAVIKRAETSFVLPLVALFLALLSIYLFMHGYVFARVSDCFQFPHPQVWEYPWFISLMFAAFGGFMFSEMQVLASLVGTGLLLFFTSILIRHGWRIVRRPLYTNNMSLIITIMVGYDLLYCLNTAVGRVCFGLPAAQASRYITLLIPVFLAGYFYLLTLNRRSVQRTLLLAYFSVVFFGFLVFHVDDKRMDDHFIQGKAAWKSCYLETGSIDYCDQSTGFKVYPVSERTQLQRKLDYLKEHRLNLFREVKIGGK